MSSSAQSVWEAEIDRRLAEGDGLEFSIAQFAAAVGAAPGSDALKAFLDETADRGIAERIPEWRCPMPSCGRVLPTAGAPYSACPFCHADYQEEGVEPVAGHAYRLLGDTSRDIRWMIVIHGMNSRAKWQEEFSWQVANRLRYSAPVLIYKYGWATIDVLVRWLHRRLAKQLGERMKIAIQQAIASDRPPRPDIVAHSFGTLLLKLVLEDQQFDDLNFGRIITAGSIIRPDFDWNDHIQSGRIEAVLNHAGAKDKAVPFAQYAIPDAGPGGTAGYDSRSTINVRAEAFGHSSFFDPDNLRTLIADGGLWHSFLTHPLGHFRPDGRFTPNRPWKPATLFLRAPARALCYLLFCVAAPASWIRRKLDP